MSDLESQLRKHLGNGGAFDAGPVDATLAWLSHQTVPQSYLEALPVATSIAQTASNPEGLRAGATRLVGRLYPLTEPVTPASVAFDPNATPDTIKKYKDAKLAWRKQGQDTLLALAQGPAVTVAAAAAIELLATATVDERRALRPSLQGVALALEAHAKVPDSAVALLQLRGTPQAIHWLGDYAAHRPIPVPVERLAQQVREEPSPEALTALESALVGDSTFKDPNFEPKLSSMANTLRLPVYDHDTERLQQMLAAVFAVDPARAQAIADKAPPKLSARLHAFLSNRP
jgi:hypothetical protein